MENDQLVGLRHLRYFLAVAQHRHFGRAAAQLGIVQPALSMQIRTLEKELGTPLFVRTSRRVDLTEAGELLVGEAGAAVAQVERAKEVVRMAARGDVGRLRIGFSGNASFVAKFIEDLRSFLRTSPGVEIELHEMAASEQAEAVVAGTLDIGYCPSFDVAARAGLSVERVGCWPWFIAMSADHPLAAKPRLHPADLADQAFVLYAGRGGDAGQMQSLRAILGREPRVSHRVGNTLTVLTIAAVGLGLALVPEPLTQLMLPGIRYRPLTELDGAADVVLLSRSHVTSGAVLKFLALARVSNGIEY